MSLHVLRSFALNWGLMLGLAVDGSLGVAKLWIFLFIYFYSEYVACLVGFLWFPGLVTSTINIEQLPCLYLLIVMTTN